MEEVDNIKYCLTKLENKISELESFKKETEETCEASAVVQDMSKRVEMSEEHVRSLIIERELYEKLDNYHIDELILPENSELLEYYIRYKLGVKLEFNYNLVPFKITKINELEVIEPDLSKTIIDGYGLGYKCKYLTKDPDNNINIILEHKRFNFDAKNNYTENKKIIDLFNNFFTRNIPIIKSINGNIGYNFFSCWRIYLNKDDIEKIWENNHNEEYNFMYRNDMSGLGTREIVFRILTDVNLFKN